MGSERRGEYKEVNAKREQKDCMHVSGQHARRKIKTYILKRILPTPPITREPRMRPPLHRSPHNPHSPPNVPLAHPTPHSHPTSAPTEPPRRGAGSNYARGSAQRKELNGALGRHCGLGICKVCMYGGSRQEMSCGRRMRELNGVRVGGRCDGVGARCGIRPTSPFVHKRARGRCACTWGG